MNSESAVVKVLVEELARMRVRNPSYSLRAFSRRLGIPVSALSEVLNGHHRVTKRLAAKTFEKIAIDPKRATEILAHLSNKTALNNEKQTRFSQIDMDQYHLISEWFYFAVLSLAETKDFKSDPTWVASRLNIPVSNAKLAIKRLVRLKMLSQAADDTLKSTGEAYKTSSGTSNALIRKSHAQNLELARVSVEQDALGDCNFSAITMAIDPARIPEAAKMIKKFRRQISDFLESGTKSEVYKIAIQLFPVSRPLQPTRINGEI